MGTMRVILCYVSQSTNACAVAGYMESAEKCLMKDLSLPTAATYLQFPIKLLVASFKLSRIQSFKQKARLN